MRLDKINSTKGTKNGKAKKVYYFEYFCPEQLKLRQFRSVSKIKATQKHKEVLNLQRTLPGAPQSSLIPLKTVIEKYKEDRLNDIKGKRLRQATYDGYCQHIRRLYPLTPDPIEEHNGGFRFKYYQKEANKFIYTRDTNRDRLEKKHGKLTREGVANDPLYAKKISVLDGPIKDLKADFIGNILDNIDRSQTTRERHFVTYTNIVSWAVKKDYLAKTQIDIIANARPAKGQKKQIEIPSEESVAKLIELSCNFWRPFWAISASTGARLGELTALPPGGMFILTAEGYI